MHSLSAKNNMDLTALLEGQEVPRTRPLSPEPTFHARMFARLRQGAREGNTFAEELLANFEARGVLLTDTRREQIPFFRHVIWTTEHSQTSLMRIGSGGTIPMETHEGFDQLVSIISGGGTLVYGDSSFELSGGSVFVIPAGTPHKVENNTDGDLLLLSFYTSPTAHEPGEIEV